MHKDLKIVFVFNCPFVQSFVNKYCLWELIELGYSVTVLDVSRVLEPEYYNSTSAKVSSDNRFKFIYIERHGQLKEFIEHNARSSIFFPMFDYIFSARSVFRLFTRYDCKYVYTNTLLSPLFYPSGGETTITLNKERMSVKHIEAAIYHRFVRKKLPHKEASSIFYCGRNGEDFYFSEGACGRNTIRHYLYSFDYENLIRTEPYDNAESEYCVFIDQYIPYHPDNTVHKKIYIDPDIYFSEVERMLHDLSIKMGVNVKIASHPQANYEDKGHFKNYEIAYGKTAALVKNASFICAHFSTASIYAVMLNKPLILLNPASLHKSDHFQKAINNLSRITGARTVTDIDSMDVSDLAVIDREKYDKCMNDNIARETPNGELLWKRIMDRVREEFCD